MGMKNQQSSVVHETKQRQTSPTGSVSNKKKSVNVSKEKAADESETNAHVILLTKKIRSARKKLEKIKTYETAAAGGKTLNEAQLELVGSRRTIEKMLAEFESLKVQTLEIVAAQEEEKKEKRVEEKQAPVVIETETTTVETATMTPVASASASLEAVEDVLKLFHVVTLHQALGKPVPSPLDFFVKVLLGTTRPPAELSFEENMSKSMEEAKKYLERSPLPVACDMTYAQVFQTVQDLINPPAVVEETFNFFTDSQLEQDTKKKTSRSANNNRSRRPRRPKSRPSSNE